MPRPSQPILSRELILRTALSVLDRTGRLNVSEVAHELGVSVSSLYHHVKGRAAIIEGIRGLLVDWESSDHRDWRNMVADWARHYRDAFARHPAAIPALVSQTVSDPAALRQYDALAAVLADAGFSARSIVLSVSMLDTLCLGAALDVGAPSSVWDQPLDRRSPLQHAIASTRFENGRSEAAFALQLSWVIDGMADLQRADLTVSAGSTGR
jgi:AcrR family transcriptional regulator